MPLKMSTLKLLTVLSLTAATSLSAVTIASAENFTLRIGAGQAMAPLEPIFTAHNYFVPKVMERVAAETDHELKFIEAYGGTVAGPFDLFEATEAGLLDIGLWCACFEPTKAVHLAHHYYVPFVTTDPLKQIEITKQAWSEFPEWTSYIEKYNQVWLGGGTYSSYGLGTKFAWSTMEDLSGHKVAGAGPNLPWISLSGATMVQTSFNEAYNSLQSGIYEGILVFPTAFMGFKLHEVADHYTVTGWGSTSIYHMSINKDSLAKLPEDIQKIIFEESDNWMDEVAAESSRRGNAALDKLREAGVTVTELPFEERAKMAEALGDWPDENAKIFDGWGLPGTAFFRRYLEIAEESGIELPFKYDIK